MITSYIQGGLGNQMFQIAAGVSLAVELKDDFFLVEGQHHLPLQGNNIAKYKNNIFKKIKFLDQKNFYNLDLFMEPKFSYTPIPKKNNQALYGYFQSEKYFLNTSAFISDLYSPTLQDMEELKKSAPFLFSESCCSIHLRFGDYLKFPDIHPTVSFDYINNGLDYVGTCDRVICFSDDVARCKKLFFGRNITYLSLDKDYLDLYAMSYCTHNVIANSSFSWWGAWLNKNINKKVVAPKTWFGPKGAPDYQDIYCNGWMVI